MGSHLGRYRLWNRAGWIGVDLFFVISGFLISGLLFAEFKSSGRIRYWRFVLRRGMKIWPAFYFLVAEMGFALYKRHPYPLHGILVHAAFLQNYFAIPGSRAYVDVLGHTWSLAVEEHFYLLLPALLMLLAARRRDDPFRPILWLFPAIAAACLAFRCMSTLRINVVMGTHMRIDSLFAGVTLGYLYHFRPAVFQKFTQTAILPVAALCIAPAAFFSSPSRQIQTWGLTALFIGFSILIAWSVVRSAPGPIAAFLAKLGSYSYSIYLWHYILSLLLASHRASAVWFWFYVILAIALGVAMAKIVETPILKLRDRLIPSEFAAISTRSQRRQNVRDARNVDPSSDSPDLLCPGGRCVEQA